MYLSVLLCTITSPGPLSACSICSCSVFSARFSLSIVFVHSSGCVCLCGSGAACFIVGLRCLRRLTTGGVVVVFGGSWNIIPFSRSFCSRMAV